MWTTPLHKMNFSSRNFSEIISVIDWQVKKLVLRMLNCTPAVMQMQKILKNWTGNISVWFLQQNWRIRKNYR